MGSSRGQDLRGEEERARPLFLFGVERDRPQLHSLVIDLDTLGDEFEPEHWRFLRGLSRCRRSSTANWQVRHLIGGHGGFRG
jgi:hypothetical protein